jgi:hypothetical protein
VYGPDGVRPAEPAEPVGGSALSAMWHAVRRNLFAHADWSVDDHLAWLDGEGCDTAAADHDPAELVGRWLSWHRALAARTTPADDPLLYVVAGGDMVAVFDDPAPAGAQRDVMEAAGLNAVGYAVTASHWEQGRLLLKEAKPWIRAPMWTSRPSPRRPRPGLLRAPVLAVRGTDGYWVAFLGPAGPRPDQPPARHTPGRRAAPLPRPTRPPRLHLDDLAAEPD